MDEFARAEERARKRYERLGVPADLQPDGITIIGTERPQEKPQDKTEKPQIVSHETKTRPPFNQLALALTNGEETLIMEFEAADLLENMMHSDRTVEGIKEKLRQILRAHLTSGIK